MPLRELQIDMHAASHHVSQSRRVPQDCRNTHGDLPTGHMSAGGEQCRCRDAGTILDDSVIEYDRTRADQTAVADNASVKVGEMAHNRSFTNRRDGWRYAVDN